MLECGMIIGWYAFCILGEKKVSDATDAKRSSEDSAAQSASQTSGSYCQGTSAESRPGLPAAQVMPSIMTKGMPDVSSALSLISSLGIGHAQTFPYYTLPLQDVEVKAEAQMKHGPEDDHGHSFKAQRNMGCTERTLDSPDPDMSVKAYRAPFWIKNLMGY
jgi:hypothetical protein